MKVAIVGSQFGFDLDDVYRAVHASGFEITADICGMAPGADTLGKIWAEENGIEVLEYPADWAAEPENGGKIRNAQMAQDAEAVIALWDGKSPGTSHMISCTRSLGKPLYIYKR